MKLSIIIPAYNEKDNILKIIEKIKQVKINLEKEIIIIDDFSTDGTREKIKCINDKMIKTIFHDKNKGKGAAVKSGIKHSTGDIIIIQDADLEYEPEDYPLLIEPIISKKAKVVYGSRVLNTKIKYSHYSFMLGGRFVTFLTNLLFFSKLTDEPTCYKVFSAEVIKKISLRGNRFEWEPEVTAKILKRKIRIYEVPINYYPRTKKQGKKINWRDGLIAIFTLFRYKFKD